MEKASRLGEERYNNFGSIMVIEKYRKATDIDVYFPEYNWTAKNKQYVSFKKGNIVCPYEKRTFSKGYIGEGKYKSRENGKKTIVYTMWQSMLYRCYDEDTHKKHSTYIGCTCEAFHCFQDFGKWFEENYYECKGEVMCLDKDILIKGNKIYSPNTCVFVPQSINKLFEKANKSRGELPLGVSYDKKNKKYLAQCSVKGKQTNLGRYDTPEEAFQVYKQFKENVIKQVADEYKDSIPEKLYNAMYEYEVEIED